MSGSFLDVFGGDTLFPADLSYRAIALSANTTLQWPTEASAQTNLVAAIMDVTASAGSLVITMPPATEVSTGTAVVFNNVGGTTFTVNDNGGTLLLTVASGLIWTAYVTSNATAAGTWKTYQNGAGSSSASAASLAGYGIKAITTTLNQSMPVTLVSINFTADATYRAGVWVWTGGAGVASLTSPVTLGNDWFTNIKNSGTGNLVLTPLSGSIDGATTVTLGPDESAIVVSDGTDFYTIGLTPTPTLGFDYAAVAVPGSGDYTLSGTELGRISYSFTGILTGTRTIIIPASVQQYWVENSTSGGFDLYVKTSAQASPGVFIPQNGGSIIVRCDGTTAEDATTGAIWRDNTYKNLCFNGEMTVAQIGAQTDASGSSSYTAVDGWDLFKSGTPQNRVDTTQSTTVPAGAGFGYALRGDVATAEAAVGATELTAFRFGIEAQDLQQLSYGAANARTIVVSFWWRSPKTGTQCVSLYQPDATRSYIREFTVIAADTYEYKVVTFPGDAAGTINNDNGVGLDLVFPLIAGSDWQSTADSWLSTQDYATSAQQNLLDNTANNIYITGVQIEVGTVPTRYDHIPISPQLLRCQRYLQRFSSAQDAYLAGGFSVDATNGRHVFRFNPVMRLAPTVTVSAAADTRILQAAGTVDVTGLTFTEIEPYTFTMRPVVAAGLTAGQGTLLGFDAGGTRWLLLSARLH